MVLLLRLHKKNLLIKELMLSSLFFTLGSAIITSIWAVYLYEVYELSKASIGFLSFTYNFLSIIFSLFLTKILKKFSKKKLILFSLFSLIIFYIILVFNNSLLILIIIISLLTIFEILKDIAYDILYKDKSNKNDLEKNEGILYTIINFAWFIAPLITSFFLLKYHISYIFLLSSFFTFISFLIFISLNIDERKINSKFNNLNNNHNIIKKKISIYQNLKNFFKDRIRFKISLISGLISVWWTFIYTFVPVIVIENGVSISNLGIFLSLVILPLILLEYRVSIWVKNFGFRNLFLFGYIIMIVGSFLAFIVSDFYLKLIFLVFGSAGTAFIEPIKEVFFFENIKKKEEAYFYPIYNSFEILGHILGKGIFAVFFFLGFSNNYSFLLLSILMFISFFGLIGLNSKKYN